MSRDTLVCYLLGIFFAAALTALACYLVRSDRHRYGRVISTVATVILLAKAGLWFYTTFAYGPWQASTGLPLYLCDFAVFLAAAACWWQDQLLVEVVYFWALSGVVQALITPDLPRSLPHLLVFQYTLGHTAVVSAAIFLVAGLRIYPRPFAVARVYLLTVLYTAIVGGIDFITGGNYMFLRRPPHSWSLLSLFGAWPWYILVAAAVALLMFIVLNLPFWLIRRRQYSVPQSNISAS